MFRYIGVLLSYIYIFFGWLNSFFGLSINFKSASFFIQPDVFDSRHFLSFIYIGAIGANNLSNQVSVNFHFLLEHGLKFLIHFHSLIIHFDDPESLALLLNICDWNWQVGCATELGCLLKKHQSPHITRNYCRYIIIWTSSVGSGNCFSELAIQF